MARERELTEYNAMAVALYEMCEDMDADDFAETKEQDILTLMDALRELDRIIDEKNGDTPLDLLAIALKTITGE